MTKNHLVSAALQRAFYLKNRDRKILSTNQYKRENKEKVANSKRHYYQINKQELCHRSSAYRTKRKAEILQQLRVAPDSVRNDMERIFGIGTLTDWYNISWKDLPDIPERKILRYLNIVEFLKVGKY
eukprot:TRINITY_DN15727_c0_g1_i1.p1 TRINITY_DN15727_c0_g1~~TRINITY_DN15727_c0_g1_i1.p1  ORF type:complete len:127 (-),score=25.54 TRINITY_DN15727_c0_g1_i1:78-458(-)